MLTAIVLPVAVAALIGLVTNFVAIKMLFHPQRRRPWWPFLGVIPKERARIARAVGRVVARELLAPDAFAAKLRTGPLTDDLSAYLVRELSRLASAETGRTLADLLGEPAIAALVDLARQKVRARLDEPATRERVAREIGRYLERVFASRPDELMSANLAAGVREVVIAEIERFRLGEEVPPLVARQVDAAIYNLLTSDRRLCDFPWVVEKIDDNKEILIGRALRFALDRIRSNRVRDFLRERLTDRVLTLYRRYMQDRWYRKVYEIFASEEELVSKLHAEFDRIEQWLGSDEAYEESKRWLLDAFEREARPPLLHSTVAEIVARLKIGELERMREAIAGTVTGLVRSDAVGGWIREAVERRVGDLMARTVEEIVERVSPREQLLAELRDGLSAELFRLLDGRRDEILDRFAEQARAAARETRPVELVDLSHASAVDAARRLFASGMALLADQMAPLLSALRIEDLVADQVERFDLDKIEALIYEVSGRELRTITWLGGLFGAMIGAAQLLLHRLLLP